jgi:hypothetical protein
MKTDIPSSTWEALALPGKTLELIHDSRIQTLRFTSAYVVATMGTKGGPVAGPILFWNIIEGRLVISREPHGDAIIDLLPPSVHDTVLSTRSHDGKNWRYAVS